MKFLLIQLLVVCCSTIGFAQTTSSPVNGLTASENDPNMRNPKLAKNLTEGQHTELGDFCPECRKNMLKLKRANSNLLNFTNPGDEASNVMKQLNKGRQ